MLFVVVFEYGNSGRNDWSYAGASSVADTSCTPCSPGTFVVTSGNALFVHRTWCSRNSNNRIIIIRCRLVSFIRSIGLHLNSSDFFNIKTWSDGNLHTLSHNAVPSASLSFTINREHSMCCCCRRLPHPCQDNCMQSIQTWWFALGPVRYWLSFYCKPWFFAAGTSTCIVCSAGTFNGSIGVRSHSTVTCVPLRPLIKYPRQTGLQLALLNSQWRCSAWLK